MSTLNIAKTGDVSKHRFSNAIFFCKLSATGCAMNVSFEGFQTSTVCCGFLFGGHSHSKPMLKYDVFLRVLYTMNNVFPPNCFAKLSRSGFKYIHFFICFPRVQFLSTVSKFESSGRNVFSKGWCLLVPIGWDGSVYILCLHLLDVLYTVMVLMLICRYILRPCHESYGKQTKLDFMVPKNLENLFKSAKKYGLQVAFDFHCHH